MLAGSLPGTGNACVFGRVALLHPAVGCQVTEIRDTTVCGALASAMSVAVSLPGMSALEPWELREAVTAASCCPAHEFLRPCGSKRSEIERPRCQVPTKELKSLVAPADSSVSPRKGSFEPQSPFDLQFLPGTSALEPWLMAMSVAVPGSYNRRRT